MRLSQLRYFIQTIESGSVNAAAKEMNVSQPTITTSIRELESELGVSLFSREKQRMLPTEAGLFFYSKVLAAVNAIDQAARDVCTKQQNSSTLTIGIPPMIGSFVIPVLVKKFNEKLPNIKLEIVEHKADTLRNMLSEGLFDFCIMFSTACRGIPADSVNIINTDYRLYVSENHPLRNKDIVTFEDIKNEKFIVFDRILLRSEKLAPKFKEQGLSPNIVMYTSQLETIKNYVRNGLAITLLLKECVSEYDGMFEVETDFDIHAQISLAWNKYTTFNPLQTTAYNIIRKTDFLNEL